MHFIKLGGVLINLAQVASISFSEDGEVDALGVMKVDGSIVLAFSGGHTVHMSADREDYDELCDDIEMTQVNDFD